MSTSYQEREDGAPLIRPEQLRMLGDDLIVALVQGSNPILVNKVLYDQDRILKPLFEGQSGPYPNPPELPDEPLAIPQEPVVPAPTQGGGAANPIADHRPEEAEPHVVADPIEAKAEPGSHDVAETPSVENDPVLDAEAEEEHRINSVRGKWRGMVTALSTAIEMYKDVPDDAEQTDEATLPGDESPIEAGKETGTPPRIKGLKRSSVAEAEAKHANDTGDAQTKPDA